MEKYEINGVEVEYDTFDLANMELFDGEFRRVTGMARAQLEAGTNPADYLTALRELADAILDAFDVLLGEGASERIFGGRINIRDLALAWNRFTAEVSATMGKLAEGVSPAAALPVAGPNREQRRAAEREQRRQEARGKAETRRA